MLYEVITVMESYVLRNPDGQRAAFGQSYERTGRGHLARRLAQLLHPRGQVLGLV